ncbi:DUF6240 domain-containing protein [Crassaminicella profunda]|uniref:DUF6240 domain-containing protein n=1 Tax=Crassaminicella profunda TaxID=1286698 RepID=UPI001CA6CBF8|nr:DUF6240 domain-containing protein [Crassaminicella profunda]QZY54295.1 flagellar hook-length control protein FliK [Crassaminicella profunda]
MKLLGSGLKIQRAYEGTIKKPFDINGTLQEKNKNKVKVAVGNKTIEAVLKNKIDERVGEHVTIDRSQIISMRVCDKTEVVDEKKEKTYEDLLKSFGIESNEESLSAVKSLKKHDMSLNKENIETLMTAKDYFHVIKNNLTYDLVVNMMDDIDLEEESLYKVSEKIKEAKEKGNTNSLLKLFRRKKEMTTEDAQKVAKNIYGSKMGRDITNIIKALHKEGVDIHKKNIEKVHDVFYKLGKLEDIEDGSFVKVQKDGIVPTIENLYNTKHYVKEGLIEGKEHSDWITNVYEESLTPVETKEKDLKFLEENIRDRLKDMKISPTKENMELAKTFIKAQVPLTEENMEDVLKMKDALKEVTEKLDIQKASQMIKEEINIEKIDLRELANVLGKDEKVEEVLQGKTEEIEKILKKLERLKTIKDTDLIKLIKSNTDFEISKIEKVVFGEVKDENTQFLHEQGKNPEQSLVKGINRIVNISKVFDKVKNLNFNHIAFQMSKGMPLTLKAMGENHEQLKEIEFPKITLSQENQLQNYMNEHEKTFSIPKISRILDAGKALLQNRLRLSIPNMQYVLESYGQYSRIRKNLSTSMVLDSVKEGKDLENMEIKELDQYVNEKTVKSMEKSSDAGLDYLKDREETIINGYKEELVSNKKDEHVNKMKSMIRNITKIGKEDEDIILLLMKNKIDFSLKEMEKISSFFKNQNQMGQKIGEFVQMLGVDMNAQWKNHVLKLKRLSEKISEKLKEGMPMNDHYEELIKHIDEMEQNMTFSEDEQKETMKDLKESLSTQKKLNRKDFCTQLPVVLGEQFKNLQVYVPNNPIKGVDEPLDVLLNLDTNHLGQTHMGLKISEKEVNLTISVKGNEEMNQLKKHIAYLREMLKEEGYTLNTVSFKTSKEENLLEGMEEKRVNEGLLNFVI